MATDYNHLIPRYSMSLEEARRMLPQVDAEKAKVGDHFKVLMAEKLSLITPQIQKKDQAIQEAHQVIDRCQKEPACVSQANNKLAASIDTIHKAIAEINAKYNKLAEEEQQKIAANSMKLEQILFSLQNSVLARVIETEIMKKDGVGGVVIETGLIFETKVTKKDADSFLNIQIYGQDRYWSSFNTSDGMIYSFASYFYRTEQEQKKVLLSFNFGRRAEYDVLRKELLSPLAETDKMIFGASKAELAKALIENLKEARYNSYSMDCAGVKPTEKTDTCVTPLKIDAVKLN